MNQAVVASGKTETRRNGARERIHSRLRRFVRVRNRYNALRGCVIGLVFGLSCIWLIVLLDSTRWLTDSIRWGLILFGYAGSGILAWRSGLGAVISSWLFPCDNGSLARDMEESCPHFRESLLASVGLRNADGSAKNGSEVLLSKIEQDTAEELSRLSITALFPWERLRALLMGIVIGLATMLTLCFIPSLRFPERLKRAMLPLVDLAPVSVWFIEVLTPANKSEIVPAEQYLEYSVRLQSFDANALLPQVAVLEWSERLDTEPSGWTNPSRVPMSRDLSKERTYSVSAPVGNKSLRYRILAGDARSPFRYLEPTERPKVVDFAWKITPPSYTQPSGSMIGDVEIKQHHGDLSLLQGSALKLDLILNQPMRKVFLHWEAEDGQAKVIELDDASEMIPTGASQQVWSTNLSGLSDGRFQVHLISKTLIGDEPLVNSFRPWYTLKWLPDSPPSVEWTVTPHSLWRAPIRNSNRSASSLKAGPNSTYWVISNTEVIELPCQVIDDYAIQGIEYEISINDEPWARLFAVDSLNSEEWSYGGKKLSRTLSNYKWDLLPFKLKSTDTVRIRIVATDRAGQKGESETLLFSVANSELTSDRHSQLILKNKISDPLRDLESAWNARRDSIRNAIAKIRDPESSEEIQREIAATIQEWLSSLDETIANSEQVTRSVLPQLDAYIDQYDFELINRGLAQLKYEHIPQLRAVLEFLEPANKAMSKLQTTAWEESRQRKFQKAEESLARGGELASLLRDFQRDLMGVNLQTAITKDATFLMKLQANATQSTGDLIRLLPRSQSIAAKVAESMLETIQATRNDIPKGLADRMDEWCRWLADTRVQLSDLAEQVQSGLKDVPLEELRGRIATDAEEWKYRRWLFHLDGGLYWNMQTRRKDVDFRTENIEDSLSRLIELVVQTRHLESNKELSSSQLTAERRLLELDWNRHVLMVQEQLRQRRETHALRAIQDQIYPADLGLVKRALESVLPQSGSPRSSLASSSELEQNLRTILNSCRILDSAHQANDARIGVEQLLEAERYDFSSMRAHLDHNLHWNAVSQQLDVAHRKMQRANFPDGLHDRYNGLRWIAPFSQANQKFASRMEPASNGSVSAAPDLEELMDAWRSYDNVAKPFLDNARNALRKLVPSISELASVAAQKAKDLEYKTTELSKAANPESGDEKSTEVKPSEEQLTEMSRTELTLAQATKNLQEALADEASRQDLLNRDARQQARDSDAALDMIERAQKNLNQALQPFHTPESLSQQNIADAINAEKRMEMTFQAIQERFEQTEHSEISQPSLTNESSPNRNSPSSPLSNPTGSLPSDAAPSSELESNYEKADKLEALARSAKEDLLRELELQLKSDSIMREELAAISESQQQSLSSELQSLGNSEKSIGSDLENSDPRVQESKRRRVADLQALSNFADRLGLRTLQQAMRLENSLGQQDSPVDQESERKFQETVEELQQALNHTGNLNRQSDLATLDSAAEDLESKLKSTLDALKPISNALNQSAEKPLADSKRRKEALQQSQNSQKHWDRENKQAADQLAQKWKREQQEQSKRLEQATKELERAKEARAQSQKNANQKPEDSWAQEDLRRKTVDVDQRQQGVESLGKSAEQFKRQTDDLERKSREVLERQSDSAQLANPVYGLAAEQIQKAQSILETVAEMTRESSRQSLGDPKSDSAPKSNSAPKSDSETLSAATDRQKQINSAVDRIQTELQRNSRHQERLQQTQSAKSLDGYLNQMQQLKSEALEPLKNSIADAASQSDSIEKEFSQANKNSGSMSPLERPSAKGIIEKLTDAANGLQSLGESIAEDASLSQMPTDASSPIPLPSPTNSNESQEAKSNSTRESMIQSRDRAQLLDRLDRMVFPQGGDGRASSSNESSGQANPVESSLRNAANQIASRMNQQRSQKMQASSQSRSGSQQSNSNQSKQAASSTGSMSEDQRTNFDSYFLPDRDSESKGDWGKLRKQAAEQNLEGSREAFDPDFDQAIQAYFRTLQTEGAK